jgi:hypothetical protein
MRWDGARRAASLKSNLFHFDFLTEELYEAIGHSIAGVHVRAGSETD